MEKRWKGVDTIDLCRSAKARRSRDEISKGMAGVAAQGGGGASHGQEMLRSCIAWKGKGTVVN